MLEQMMLKGAQDAVARLKLGNAEAGMLGGLLGKAKSFGAGQLAAGKDLVGNLRGGLGGASPHAPLGGEGPVPSPEWHRGQAVGNLKTLAPSLLAGGGLYMMHRHNQQQEEQQHQQALAQQGYGQQPMM